MQAAMGKKYLEEQLPRFLASFEEMLKQNKNGDGFFVGDEVNEDWSFQVPSVAISTTWIIFWKTTHYADITVALSRPSYPKIKYAYYAYFIPDNKVHV